MAGRRLLAAILIAGTVSAGCVRVPRAVRRIETHRTVRAPPEAVFDAAIRVAARQAGTIIAAERESGVLSYKVPDPRHRLDVFVNLYVRRATAGALVLVARHSRDGAYVGEVADRTLEEIARAVGQ